MMSSSATQLRLFKVCVNRRKTRLVLVASRPDIACCERSIGRNPCLARAQASVWAAADDELDSPRNLSLEKAAVLQETIRAIQASDTYPELTSIE